MTPGARRTDAGLVVEALAVPFGSSDGLPAVSLALAPGERAALVGPSGEGKTTLLRAIAGLAPTTGGRIALAGRDLAALPPEQRDVVYLHQSPLLFPHLDVAGNVGFPLAVRGVPRAEIRRRVTALLERVGLAPFAARPVQNLSGGQRHRVALARALAARPAVLLLDEPFAALDPALRAEVRAAVSMGLDAEGPAVILVTHDVDEAAAFATRLLVLLGRRIAQDGTPGDVLRAPASLAVARFLGIPNRVRGVVADGRFASPVGGCPWFGPPGPATLVARADALRAVPADDGPCRVRAVHERIGGVVVAVDGPAGPLQALGGGALPIGSAVTIAFDERRIHVLPEVEPDV